MCLGHNLGRQEMQFLVEHILPALKWVELAGEPDILQSRVVAGFKHFPFCFEMEVGPSQ